MLRFAKVFVLVAFLAVVTGCGSKVSKATYDKIQVGMSEKEVVALLGRGVDITNPSKAPAGGSFGGAAGGIVAPTDMGSGGYSSAARLPGVAGSKVIQWEEGDRIIQVGFDGDKVKTKQIKG